eukprot:g13064.t1
MGRFTLFAILGAALVGVSSAQPGSVGCFADNRSDRVLTAKWSSSEMTPTVCADYCREQSSSYTHYATQYGRECWCQDDSIDLTQGAGTCDYQCSGDDSIVCGGFDSFSLYDLEELPSPPTDKNYMGCFADDRNERVLGAKSSSREMTSEACASYCTEESPDNTYYATQWGQECWCAAEIDLRHGDGTCDIACTGDSGTTCGGFYAFDLFELESSLEDPYLGCFADDKRDRVLGDKMSSGSMSLQVCEDYCTAMGKPFFALQWGEECWCGGCDLLDEGNRFDRHGATFCTGYPCTGEASRDCGAFDAFSLYYRGTCTQLPTIEPSFAPTDSPTSYPTLEPAITAMPTTTPTSAPTSDPASSSLLWQSNGTEFEIMETAEWGVVRFAVPDGSVSFEVPEFEGEVAELYYNVDEQRLAQVRVGAEVYRIEYDSNEEILDIVLVEDSGGSRALQIQSGAQKGYHLPAWISANAVQGVKTSRISCDNCGDVVSGVCFAQSKLCSVNWSTATVGALLLRFARQAVLRVVPVLAAACVGVGLLCDANTVGGVFDVVEVCGNVLCCDRERCGFFSCYEPSDERCCDGDVFPISSTCPTPAPTPAPTSELTPAPTSERTPAPTSELTPAPTSELTPAPTSELTPAPTPEPDDPKRGGSADGDPHLQIFDGTRYDCQGQGEFVLTKAAATESEVQARFEQWSRNPNAGVTVATGIAAREGTSSLIQVTLVDSGGVEVLVDGELYDAGADPSSVVGVKLEGVALEVTSSQVEMRFASGLDVFVTNSLSLLGIRVYAPVSLATTGLLGNNNGVLGDDFLTVDGETVSFATYPPTLEEGTNYCTTNWCTTSDASLFTYAEGEDHGTFDLCDVGYVAPVIPDVIPASITELCGDNADCTLDALLAGEEVGQATLAGQAADRAYQEDIAGLCASNSFSSTGAPPCTTCPDGEVSGTGATECIRQELVGLSLPENIAAAMVADATGGFAGPGSLTLIPAGTIELTQEDGGSVSVSGTFIRDDGASLPSSTSVFIYIENTAQPDDFVRGQEALDSSTGAFSTMVTDIPEGSSRLFFSFVVVDPVEALDAAGADTAFAFDVSNSACVPSLTITLEWTGETSDVDLFVVEPAGAEVFYGDRFGDVGFLDNDDSYGFGPENYIIDGGLNPETSQVLGEYTAYAVLFSGDEATETWRLTARVSGEVAWIEEGDFTSSRETDGFVVSLADYDATCGGLP